MMSPIDHGQIKIMSQVNEFKKECTSQGLRVDDGQAFECLSSNNAMKLARRFHHENIRYYHSVGNIHFGNSEDDFFDLPAPQDEETEDEDAEEKLNAIMVMCPPHREKIAEVLMEMRRPGGAPTITSAAQAVGISRSYFYKLLDRTKWWVSRPPVPEGWDGNDCYLLVQMDLDLGVAE
jgi:hypothetical protein